MKCEELLAMLNDYVDGDIPPGVCETFEKHLAGCNPCQIVVDNIRKTITLYKDGKPYDTPPAFQRKLRDLVRQRWQRKFGWQRAKSAASRSSMSADFGTSTITIVHARC